MKRSKKKNKKETKHSSLVVRWVSVVALTIMVSFIVFSFIIYSFIGQQSMGQQKETSNEIVSKLNSTLNRIPTQLEISNVVPALTPSTREVLKGNPPISSDQPNRSAFNDDLLSSLTNRDLNVVVYNLRKEDVFDNGNAIPPFKKIKGDHQVVHVFKHHREELITYQKVRSARSGKVTGYIVVANKMTYYNGLMKNLLKWMARISVAAIIFFTLVAFIIVRDIVKPIK